MADRPPMYLLTGPEELLLHRGADDLLEQLRAGGELEVSDVRASELADSGLPDLRTASLFGAPRALVIREAQELPAALGAALVDVVETGAADTTVILLATGTGRIQKLARRIADRGGRVDIAPPKEWEERRWVDLVHDEFARLGRRADGDAVEAILGHAGLDVSAVAEKTAQVVAAAPPGRITVDHVEAVVVGHGNRGSFAVADAMCQRDPARALTLLRGVLESGADPVMVLGALAYRLRSIVAVAGRIPPKSIGLGVSRGQARHLQGLRANFGPGELTDAYRRLADVDREIKGGEVPARFALERAVVTIATARGA